MVHKQVPVECFGRTIEVDEGMVEVLSLIWERGIRTQMSCQECRPGVGWIAFPDDGQVKGFLNVVARPDEEMYRRICGFSGPRSRWQFSPMYMNFGQWERVDGKLTKRAIPIPNDFDVTGVSLNFPLSDLPQIVANLQA